MKDRQNDPKLQNHTKYHMVHENQQPMLLVCCHQHMPLSIMYCKKFLQDFRILSPCQFWILAQDPVQLFGKKKKTKVIYLATLPCSHYLRASKEVFNVKNCVGIDLSEDMLRVAEQLEGTFNSFVIYSPYLHNAS